MFIKERVIGKKEVTAWLIIIGLSQVRLEVCHGCLVLAAVCMIDDTACPLIRCPLDPCSRSFFFVLWFEPWTFDRVHSVAQKWGFCHSGLCHIATNLDSRGECCIAHLLKVLTVTWHPSFFSGWLESELELPIVLACFRPAILTRICHVQPAISCTYSATHIV